MALGGPDAGADARPGGRHRLRAVHRLPHRARAGRGHGARGVRRPGRRHRRLARWSSPGSTVVIALAGAGRRRHPVPDRDGPRPPPARSPSPCSSRSPCCPRCSASPARGSPAGKNAGPRGRDADGEQPTLGARWVGAASRAAPVAVAGARRCSRLGALRVPALAAARSACPTTRTAAPTPTQRKAYDLIAEGFGPGFNGPLIARGRRRTARPMPQAAADQVDRGRLGAARRRRRRRPRRSSTRRATPAISRSSRRAARPTQATEDLVARDPRPRASRRHRRDLRSPGRPRSTSTSPRSWPARCCPTWRSSSASRSCC